VYGYLEFIEALAGVKELIVGIIAVWLCPISEFAFTMKAM